MQKKVLLAGGTGMIGRQIQTILKSKGYLPAILTRGDSLPEKNIYHWDPVKKTIDSKALDQCFGVINLAGTNIGQWPWTKARKQEIASSRIESTTFLMEQIRTAPHPPEVYINASATGFYPDEDQDWLLEDHAPDNDFLGTTCHRWESAVHQNATGNCRVCIVRIGLVMSTRGGIYPKFRLGTYFKMGVKLGSGNMYYSWIHLEDLARMFVFLLENKTCQGVYNGVSPHPLTMKSWMEVLAEFHKTWLTLPLPAWLLKLLLGDFAQLLLKGGRVSAQKIQAAGFTFNWPEWKPALEDLNKRST